VTTPSKAQAGHAVITRTACESWVWFGAQVPSKGAEWCPHATCTGTPWTKRTCPHSHETQIKHKRKHKQPKGNRQGWSVRRRNATASTRQLWRDRRRIDESHHDAQRLHGETTTYLGYTTSAASVTSRACVNAAPGSRSCVHAVTWARWQ